MLSSLINGSINRTRAESNPVARDPPQLRRIETFEQKLYRKFSQQPLVPIGCLVTAYFLGTGIKSFYNRDASRSQKMMRLRVGAQFATLIIFVGYYGLSEFDLTPAPMYQAAQEMKKDEKN
mmetsp:Transcript_19/g.29  ORF Transcript_19/g.29 Transcript_19/m.29 type:complete len:121 (+) Transcript_19:55-417(+)|eukprot:CAMPEP_0202458786 /NCGR_PEP_ID=MMETSP1360-20130828/28118_1 /ASSEMBLY_ACC=CAM_ASM_000848 /TAXON_ID=515479 /ORGANISM="Licmophora paradoxa, Strain CCMP2313" /LENGTH=120 /DNA_ID=CAMNT_0049079511 /DNA_START=51 /DNA_END=413 /DNA_ORIENTATION=+